MFMVVGIESILDNSGAEKECKSVDVGDHQGERQALQMT